MNVTQEPASGAPKAMLLAAGLGTRLKPWTDNHPKCLAQVNGKSLLQKNIEYLQQFGIRDVIINVHHFAEQVIKTVEDNNGFGSNITISDERNALLETGGGLKKAAWYFEGEQDLLLMNSDILTDLNISALIQQHRNTEALVTLAVSERTTSRYFLFDKQSHLCGWENIKTGEKRIEVLNEHLQQKAFSGIQVISTAMLPLMKQEGKFSLVDVYLSLCSQHTIIGYDHSDSLFLDVGKPESLEKAESLFP